MEVGANEFVGAYRLGVLCAGLLGVYGDGAALRAWLMSGCVGCVCWKAGTTG